MNKKEYQQAIDAALETGARHERERIIQVLLRTDPVTVEDRCLNANPFTGCIIQFDEAALREALKG